jgi:MFS transporter, SHS family, lactate transporter
MVASAILSAIFKALTQSAQKLTEEFIIGMKFAEHFRKLSTAQRNTFIACFLGWSLDAFDFFILTFCISALSAQFQVKVSDVTQAVFITLAFRPVGAFLFGLMADRFGRRRTLMVDIIAYSVFELASAFAPSLKVFIITRALFGIAMGGEWGVGAALAFETLPSEERGFFSGLLQEGYAVGFLMAALVYGTVFEFVGWRGMFVIGALPAFLVIYIRSKVDESPAWLEGRRTKKSEPELGLNILKFVGPFLLMTVLMFAFNSFSHGTQDLYPTFLTRGHHFGPRAVMFVAVIANIGALVGGVVFGSWSERIGRRKAIVIAALLSVPVIPLWAYSHSISMLALGGFLMQFMVQGAWGVIPAHLNELSPAAVRGTFPGFAYQLGNLLASKNSVLQARLVEQRYRGSYAPMLAWTVLIVASLVALVTMCGRERRGADLSKVE